ncbi:hypothetical protein BGZ80_000622 [Entomortierella chlamydospora]|uniref:Sacsin/Nov domain-containing protein n=1 Tax=Entomortierella chlamydospora TaxID=101097 RepID=A0A9P6MRZ1_9FUNG|nr:hypothetical protein BGZ80_000622 [Entomortierella chlamydospora]
MASKKSALDALRSQVLSHTGAEERVEVNQRHLIDKILARYSAEFVVYRELMQNSDDAGAKGIEIVFETASPNSSEVAPNLSAKITRVLFKNNGMDFRPEDWNRLKKIAEGNPDESKIGAFGVGFYSLFSICEEPFVSSGKECMAFYWRNDQLYAKRATIPDEEAKDGWTTFLLDLREPMEIPNMDDFGPFLARSLGFTGNLRDVSVYLNHHRLLNISKKMREPRPMTLPKTMYMTSPQKIFTLKSVDLQNVQMDATRMEVSRWTREVTTSVTTIFLRTASGNLDVKVSKQFAAEMERTTKKYPPSQTAIQILYVGHDEKQASAENKTIFKDLVPFPEQGRIFIGFPTHQTTGFCSHVAGRFIPTVERESLDFVDKSLQVWNHELLSMAGLLSRALYEDELSQIGSLYNEMILAHHKPEEVDDPATATAREWLEKRALHALQAFQFHPSTPSPQVGHYIDAYFFRMSTLALSILSSHGVKELDKVRIPDSTMSAFLKQLPTIPTSVYTGSQKFIDKLEKAGKVQKISFNDVLRELESRTLTEPQMVAMLKWWIDFSSKYVIPNAEVNAFFQLALVCSGDSVKPLSTLKWFVNPKVVPTDMPFPPNTIPYDITKTFTQPELSRISTSWSELSLLEWTKFIVNEPDFVVSPVFAEKVLLVLSRGWPQLHDNTQRAIVALLAQKTCIPTKYGMKTPNESYFKTVTLFPDLPVMVFTKQPLEKLLLALGARKSVELQLVFDRLVNAGSWDHMQLVKYLTSVRDTLSSGEIKRLKATPIFPKEDFSKEISVTPPPVPAKADGTGLESSATPPPVLPIKRYPANALYVPTEDHIALGLPVIEWKGRWRSTLDESKLLLELGLLTHPSLDVLLGLAAPPSEKDIQVKALQYFIDNFKTLYMSQYNPSSIKVAFLPTTSGSLETPERCFSNPSCSIMEFPVLREDLRVHAPMLRIRENPLAAKLLERLTQSPPATKEKARQVFEFLGKFQGEFSHHHWLSLRSLKFIPLDDSGESFVDPQSCYFDKKDSAYHPDLLTTVDFGGLANQFLKSCGVKEEPTPIELTQLVIRSPNDFLNRNGGVENYKSILRQIASQMHVIRTQKALVNEMIRSPFLLGEKRINQDPEEEETSSATANAGDSGADAGKAGSSSDENAGQVVVQYKLARASDIYLIDDTVLQQIFTPLSAPMESLLETLYESLGSTWISKQVKEISRPQGALAVTRRSENLQELIVERAPLLLSDHPANRLNFDLDWLTTKLKVRQVPEIQLRREFIPTGATHTESTTACIAQDQAKAYYLLVTAKGDMDYFDIADVLAKLLLKKKKLNDSIWWSNLLFTSLLNLKRKGFQVDRILNAKKAEKARIEAAAKADAAAATQAAGNRLGPKQTAEYLAQLKEVFPDCDPAFLMDALSKETQDHVQRVTMKLLDSGYPRINKGNNPVPAPAPVPGSFPTQDSKVSTISTLPPAQPSVPAANQGSLIPGGGGSFFSRLRNLRDSVIGKPMPSDQGIVTGVEGSGSGAPTDIKKGQTPVPPTNTIIKDFAPDYQQNLQQSLKAAVSNCRSNGRDDIRSEPTATQVSEVLTNSYCDVKPGHQLDFAGHAGELEFYLDKDCNADEIMTKENLKSLARFVRLLMTLAQDVFGLAPETMHIYYDPEGQAIAFNRGGSLFFNWRYYVALGHDDGAGQAKKQLQGKTVTAREEGLIYWFFTMAHELAHNFVGEHNSKHEFYFSSFCEQYLPALMTVMAATSVPESSSAATPASAANPPNIMDSPVPK